MPVIEDHISDQAEAAYRVRKKSSTSIVSASHGWSQGPIDSPRTPVGFGPMEANSGSYFKASVQLSIIIQSILTSLYNPSTTVRSPADIQSDMAQLDQRLDQWVLALPQEFNFQIPVANTSMLYSRERMLLGFQLCSARMLLGRLCLNPRRQMSREGNEVTFARRLSNSCIEAAKTIVDFLPEEPSARFIYDQGPWWCIVHHIMQAVSVFLLGLSYPASISQDGMTLIQYVKKAVWWLQVLQDPVASRAYQVAASTFEIVLRRHDLDVSGIWKMGSAHVGGLHHAVDPSMAVYAPTQHAPPAGSATYAAYDNLSTAPTYPAYGGTAVFVDNYHMGR